MKKIVEKIKTFFKEVWQEAKKIDWPTRQETFRYTLIVIGISVAVAAFLGILDFIFLKILGKFIF
ncbi:preprotein translocase subunit SecE [bacterium]|nr:preprotein translocase subunit SecE [bacterium]